MNLATVDPICENTTPFSLDDLLDPNFSAGSWSGDGVNSNNEFDPSLLADGSNSSTLTFTAQEECVEIGTTSISINALQQMALTTPDPVCENATPFSLDDFVDPNFSTGTWSGVGVNNNEFDPSLLADGVNTSTLSFTTQEECVEIGTTSISINALQQMTLATPDPICENTTSFSLDDFTDPNFSAGTWSGDGVNNNEFDPTNLTGTITLTFFPDENCVVESSTIIEITTPGPLSLSTPDPICENENLLLLNQFEDPDFPSGTWSGIGVNDNEFDPTGQNGMVELSFEPTGCAEITSIFIDVLAIATPNLSTDVPTSLCENDNSIDLSTYTSNDYPNGIWEIEGTTTPIFNPSEQLGTNSLNFNSGEYCTMPVSLELLVEPSITPSLTAGEVCEGLGSVPVLLFGDMDYPTGTWSSPTLDVLNENLVLDTPGSYTLNFLADVNCAELVSTQIDIIPEALSQSTFSEAICSGETIEIEGLTFDENNLSGEVVIPTSDPLACDSVIFVNLNLDINPELSLTIDEEICAGQEAILQINSTTDNNFDLVYSNGNETFEINNISNGSMINVSPTVATTYSIVQINAYDSNCAPEIGADASVNITELTLTATSLNTSNGFDISCNGSADGAISVAPNNGTAPYSYLWNTNATTNQIENLPPATYIVTVTDANNCESEETLTLTEPPANEIALQANSPACSGTAGSVTIDLIAGAANSYEYSLDGIQFESITSFPFMVNNILAGDYQLSVQDENDCQVAETFTIDESIEAEVAIANGNIGLTVGESTNLTLQTNLNPVSIVWSANNAVVDCTNCETLPIAPTNTTTYSVTATDANGCSETDQIIVVVEQADQKNIFIPNVFSPNADGFNDYFLVYGNERIQQINYVHVFDRWGTQVFSTTAMMPNDELTGWDGMFRNQKLQTGTYTYVLEVEYDTGLIEIIEGDVSLVR